MHIIIIIAVFTLHPLQSHKIKFLYSVSGLGREEGVLLRGQKLIEF